VRPCTATHAVLHSHACSAFGCGVLSSACAVAVSGMSKNHTNIDTQHGVNIDKNKIDCTKARADGTIARFTSNTTPYSTTLCQRCFASHAAVCRELDCGCC
jgi:hypothetical protein